MRILIADDEELTRKGIISSRDWENLGISQIDSADDGIPNDEWCESIVRDFYD